MSLMSDNEIEDVSFLPGEHLNRGAVYEPNILQKLKLLACNRGRAAVIAVVGCMLLLIIALIAALSNRHCSDTLSDNQERINDHSGTTIPLPLEDYISTNGKLFPYRDIKLPDSVTPVNYKLFIHPNITNSVFNGTVEILCHIKKDTDFIVLHVKNLRVTQLKVKEKETGNHATVTEQLEYKTNEQLYVGMGTRLISGSEVMLQMTFDGNLSNKLAGFYRSMYKTSTGEQRFIATTHFEPTDARAAFPCFDEPNLKATFELSIVHEKNYIALSNMPLMKQEKYETDLLQDTFQQTVKMSTYLVAFVVCDYKNLTQETKRNISVGVYAPANSIYAADFALSTAIKIIDYYEEFFGIHYPLPKLDLIAIPDFAAGAMENWGLITYRMTAILYDPIVNSVANKERVAVVIAHELAHQWFGNLVTMAWWDDLWLNEGFASYVEYIGSGIIDQEWKMQDQFVTDTLLNAMYLDSLENSHPVYLPVSNPNQINELFDAITYDKGASIIRMLNSFLGNEVFKAGLISYLNKYNFSNAATNDLWRSLSQAVTDTQMNLSTEVTTLMRTWTEQTGYPVVTLSRSAATSKVTLTQSRFLLYKQSNNTEAVPSPFGYKWEIPFCYSTDAFTPNKILIKDVSVTIEVGNNPKWIKGNCGMSGYYRVNYDEDNWHKLIQQLNRNHTVFSDTERAGLIDDALMLARNGNLKYQLALDLSLYLVNERSYIPWKTFLDHLGYLWRRFEDKDIYPKFKTFLIKLIKHLLEFMVWEDTGTHLDKYLRASILDLAVKLGHEPAVKKGTECFQQWTLNNSNININLKSVIYKAGMMYGTADDWEYVWNAFLNESDASESRKLLSALGQTKDVGLLLRLLQYGLNESIIRSQDTITVVASVADSLLGQVLVWPFFQQNWLVFHDRYSTTSFIMSELIKRVTSNLDTKFDYDDVKAFFSKRDVGSGARAVNQSLERIQIHMDWISKYQNEVTDWLNKHGN